MNGKNPLKLHFIFAVATTNSRRTSNLITAYLISLVIGAGFRALGYVSVSNYIWLLAPAVILAASKVWWAIALAGAENYYQELDETDLAEFNRISKFLTEGEE